MKLLDRCQGKLTQISTDLKSKKFLLTSTHTYQKDGIKFYTPTALCRWRADTMYTKEPGTIDWINAFEANSVFWDVGANIGLYSLYASKKKQVRSFAFEPSPFNYSVLSRNIYLNRLSSMLSVYCVALTDKNEISHLNLSSVYEGAAHTSFKDNINEFGDSFEPVYSHSTIGFTIDSLIAMYGMECPNYLKIDVDGAESRVIAGAKETLLNPQLKSVLIELTSDLSASDKQVFDTISQSGFSLARQDHPDGDVRLCNYIFNRDK